MKRLTKLNFANEWIFTRSDHYKLTYFFTYLSIKFLIYIIFKLKFKLIKKYIIILIHPSLFSIISFIID